MIELKQPLLYVASIEGYVKIGHTSDIRRRLRRVFSQLKPAAIRGTMADQLWARPGSRKDESFLHGSLRPYHEIGEWYSAEVLRSPKLGLGAFEKIPLDRGAIVGNGAGAHIGHNGAGGRPPKPSFCSKCGARCDSATAAREHPCK